MYGNLHLPPNSTAISITEFHGQNHTVTSSGESDCRRYIVPPNATFLWFFMVAGGGGGASTLGGVGNNGGGGGGSSAIMTALIPTMLIPSTLWIRPGKGGSGGSGSGGGTNGEFVYVGFYSTPTGTVAAGNLLFRVRAGQGGGIPGGGPGGIVPAAADAIWSALALWTAQGGVAGGAGTTGAGTAVAFNALLPLTGGGGGSGSTTAAIGGGVTAQAGYTQIPNILGGALGGGNGFSGTGTFKPFGGCGGTGGGSIAGAGTGSKGGNGWYGCGGGGGGATTTADGSATGGDGGPGYCLIVAF